MCVPLLPEDVLLLLSTGPPSFYTCALAFMVFLVQVKSMFRMLTSLCGSRNVVQFPEGQTSEDKQYP